MICDHFKLYGYDMGEFVYYPKPLLNTLSIVAYLHSCGFTIQLADASIAPMPVLVVSAYKLTIS